MKTTDSSSKFLHRAFRKRPKQRTSQKVELQFEKLEPRQMLVGDLVFHANFEDVDVAPGQYAFFSEVSGLTATVYPVEVQNHVPVVGPASEGHNLLELDGTNGVYVRINNVPSNGLLLQGDYSPRRGFDKVQNEIEVLWNGTIIATLAKNGQGNQSTEFERFQFTLPAKAGQTTGRLEFRSTIENDTLAVGGLLDDIKVFEFDNAQRAPKLNPINDRTVNEGETLTVQFSATDADSSQNQLRFSTPRAPVGSTLDPVTGVFKWTPNQFAGGLRFGVDVVVTDETGLTDTRTFRVTVNDVANQAPRLQMIDDQTTTEGETISVQLVATDADSAQSQLRFSTPRAPVGSTLDPVTGIFKWTPNQFAGGRQFGIDVVVTDETGLTDTKTFRVTVNEVANQAPQLQMIDDQTITERETISLQLVATDADSAQSQLRFSTSRAPVGSTLDPVTGVFNWTPNQFAGGLRFGIDVVVTDETGLTDDQTFWINVEDIDGSPVLQTISDQSIRELEPITIQLVAMDSNSDQSQLRYAATRSPIGSALDPITGLFTWTPNAFAGGFRFGIDVRVTDETGLSNQKTFRIDVENLNTAPVLATIDDQSVAQHSQLTFTATATDADRPFEPLTFALSGNVPNGAVIDPVTGQFTWTPMMDSPAGNYTFNVVVEDSNSNQDSQAVNVSVTSVDDDIRLVEESRFETVVERLIPISEDTKQLSFDYETLFDILDVASINDAFEAALLDADGDSLVHTIASDRDAFFNLTEGELHSEGVNTLVDGSTVKLDLSHIAVGTTATLAFRLINNDYDDRSEVLVTSIATSEEALLTPAGASTDSPTDRSLLPIDFESLRDVTGSMSISYGQTSLNQAANSLFSQIELTNVGQVAIAGRTLAVLENPTNELVGLIRPDGRLPDGRFFIELTSESGVLGAGETTHSRDLVISNPDGDRFDFDLTILAGVNSAPTRFTSIPPTDIEAGRTVNYTAVAEDPEGQMLQYSVVTGHENISIDAETGEMSWLTTVDEIGSHVVTLRATDPFGLYVEQTFTIEVHESLQNRPPIFTSSPVTEAIASSGFEITTVATGAQPAGVGVTSGFHGPRLVTINAGDQTVGVYAGENNDRFDDATIYSTGFPAGAGQLFDVGYSVDIGLPEFRLTNDSNSVFGLDQGDLNGDGVLDLAVLYAYDSPGLDQRYQLVISTLLGDGDGGFGSPVEIYRHDIGSNSYDVRNLLLRDVNNDGALDVLAAERQRDPRLITILGNGDGTFDAAVEQTFTSTLSDFRTVDVDEDGKLDLIGRTAILGFGATYEAVWLKGNGDGTFGDPIVIGSAGSDANCCYATQQRPHDVLDLNGDDNLDLALLTDAGVAIYHSDGNGNFTLASEFQPSTTDEINWVRGGDFNNDGDMDLAYHDSWNGQLNTLIGDGSGVDFVLQVGAETDAWFTNYAGDDAPIDVDGDGDLDLIFAHSNNDWTSTKVALNDGAGNFSISEFAMVDFSGEIKPFSAGDIARGAMFGDYNQDGVIDFSYFTAGDDFNGVGIRLGTRPGEFGQTRTVPWIAGSSQDALPGDYNGDGIVDLLDTVNDRISLGNGDGTYMEPFPAVGVSRPSGFGSSADFNLDGMDDVVATRANTHGSRYYVALANGDGTFTVSDDQLVESSFYGYSATMVADFNNDGYPDFVAKSSIERQIDVHLNDPNNPGVFSRTFRVTLPVGSQGINVSNWDQAFDAMDYTGDGIVDLAYAQRDEYSADSTAYIVIMAGDGSGNFSQHSLSPVLGEDAFYAVNGGSFYAPGDFNSGDLDGDGDMDLISVTNYGARVFLNDGTGSFDFVSWLEFAGFKQRGRDSWLVDFNEDGNLDLFQTGGSAYGPIILRLGNGDGTFAEPDQVGLVGAMPGSISRQPFADLDGDGHMDFVYGTGRLGNYRSETVSVFAGRRDDLVDMMTVDLNGDGNEEILAIQEQMDRLQIFAGDNLGGFTRQPDLQTGRAPQAVAVTDLNGDGKPEILTVNRASRSISVFSGSLDAGFNMTEFPVGTGPIDVAAANLNSDEHQDIVVLDDAANALWLFAGDGTATLGTPTAIALGDRPSRLSLADATGDGITDAIVTLPDSNRLMILPGDGAGDFGAPIYVQVDAAPSDVAVVDLNDDGNPDLATTLTSLNVLSVLYGSGNNQFSRAQNIVVGDSPNRVNLSDADQDGRMDLIVSNSGDATASVIYNRFDPNEVYRYDSDAIDPDNDALTYSIVDGPGGLIINSQSGELLWAASPDQVGEHEVTIAADDGRGGVATQTFRIDVQPARENASPLIATEPNVTIGANEAFNYSATAVDGDNDTLRYRLLDGPEGASVDPTTGEVHWDGRGQAFIYAPYGPAGDVRVPADTSLQSSDLTVEGWFNNHTLSASNGASILFSLPGEFGHAYYLRFLFNSQFQLIMDFEGERVDYRPAFEVNADRWYHIALTVDDSAKTATIWVDGQVVGSTNIPNSIGYSADGVMEVGQRASFPTMATLDNFRVWNVARSAAEIQEGMARQYENDPRIVLDYRFEDIRALSVQDYSDYGNFGYRTTNGMFPLPTDGLVDPGQHDFTIAVEDGRGGYDEQSFTVNVLPELRGSIAGHLFNDLDGDGIQDDGSENPAEPSLEGWRLYIDTNGNHYPDPGEMQTITNANGDYHFDQLLPGNYPLRVDPVAGFQTPIVAPVSVEANHTSPVDIAAIQRALSQIQGQLKTSDGQTIGYWNVYADLDQDGTRSPDEPSVMTDRDGVFALFGLDAGSYTVRAKLPAGWQETAEPLVVDLVADEISTGNDIVVAPTNTSVTGGVRFVTTPPTTVTARDVFRYSSVATSIIQQAITYDVSLAPDGLTIDPTSGLVAWRPTILQVGDHQVILRATAADGSISLHDFTVAVAAPNTAPVIASTAPVVGFVGKGFAYDLAAQDAEMEAILFTLIAGPASATLDPDSGHLRWTPAAGDIGVVNLELEARDASGGTSTQQFAVTISADQPNATPFNITSPRENVGLGQDYVSRVVGVDQLNRPLTWTKTSGPAGLIVNENGDVNWTANASDLGQHTIELTATSVDSETEDYSFTITVVGQPVLNSPEIVSEPTLSTVIGAPYSYDVQVEDAEDNLFAFALLDAPLGMSIHPSNGTIRWTPAVDEMGEADVLIEATDPNGSSATQSFKLKVSRSGGPPIITSTPPTEVNVGGTYLYSVVAQDAEGDPLSYRLLTAPAGVTIVEETGEISWTPTAAQLGQQEIVIEVSDGIGGAATQAFAILVGDGTVNLPPVIESTAPRFSAVGSEYGYQIVATDPESTSLTYTVGRGPTGLSVDGNGLVAWTPATGQTGKFVVTLVVTDAGGASAIESFELDVLAENRAPVINSTAPATSVQGAAFRYDILVTDADLDPLQFELVTAPAGATINAFGQIEWNTDNLDVGQYGFEVKVTDPRGGEATQSFTIDLVADTEAPSVSLIENLGDASRNILPWQGPFKVFVRAIDNVEVASLTLSANGQDIPLDADGTATFTFEDWTFQAINATATAIDTSGNETTKSITFDYDFPEGWSGAGTEDIPMAEITSPADTASVFGMVSVVGTAAHVDFFGYKLSYRRADATSFTEFFENTTPVTGGELGVWDTSLLLNDEYVIRLEVATNAGVVNVVEHNVGLAGELKLGNFQLAFTDMVIPVAGIPIEITRIYDTLQADREGDFGYGWRLEFRDTDLRVGLPKSGLEDIGIFPALRSGAKVYLNIPGQGRQGFTFNPDIRVLPGFGGENLVLARPRFTPDPGVTSSLSTGTSGYLQVNDRGELYAPGGIPYNPASPNFGGAYVLTTSEGITYRVNGSSGLLDSASDRNGNVIRFGDEAVVADGSGRSLDFSRDANGRIIEIIDGEGNSYRYQYDSGNLVKVIDQAGNESTIAYDDNHRVTDLTDPLGQLIEKNVYSDDGRLLSRTDSSGRTVAFEYDPNSRQEVSEELDGTITVTDFDNRGNVIRITNALGEVIEQDFDENDNLVQTINALNSIVNQTYDQTGNLLSRVEADGSITRFTYTQGNRLASTTDALGNVVRFDYDSNGNLLRRIDNDGQKTIARVVDEAGNIVSQTDAAGGVTSFSYNQAGDQTTYVDAAGNVAMQSYDSNGVVIEYTSPLGTKYSFQTDARGLYRSANANGGSAEFTFNALGNLESLANANGDQVFDFILDGEGRETEWVNALGDSQFKSYDLRGNLVEIVNERGEKIRYAYDAVGRRIRTESEDGGVIQRRYDAAGQIVEITNPVGGVTRFEYDVAGRMVSTTDPIGNKTDLEYDALGRLTRTIDSEGDATETVYDDFGQVVATIFADGSRVEQEYDILGQLISQTDPLGLTKRFTYDAIGNLAAVLETDGSLTQFEYNAESQLTRQEDALGRVTEFAYDEMGRLTSTTYPDGSTNTTTYDSAGFVESRTNGLGETTEFSVDAEGRILETRFADGSSESFTYNAAGQIASSMNSAGTTSYLYDNSGRVSQINYPNSTEVRYTYDTLGNRASVTTRLPDNLVMTSNYTYDNAGRMTTVQDSKGIVTTYRYDSDDNVVSIEYGNGVIGSFTYDSLNRLESASYARNGTTIESVTYVTDEAGQRESATYASGRQISYQYNERGWLILEVHQDSAGNIIYQDAFDYDLVGNTVRRVTNGSDSEFSYNETDQLVSGGEISYRYDNEGRLIELTGDGSVSTFEYDAEGQLVQTAVDGVMTSYVYDASGTRLTEVLAGESTQFVTDLIDPSGVSQVIATYEDSTGRSVHYVHGDRPISQTDTETEYLHQDGSRNVVAISDAIGSVIGTKIYSAFGTVLVTNGVASSLGFAGEQTDRGNGLVYLRARYYSPETGGFLSRDPFKGIQSDPQSLHRYLYGNNNPLSNVDPTGEAPFNLTETQIVVATQATIGAGISFVSGYAAGKRGFALVTETFIGGAFGAFGGAYGSALSKAFTSSTTVAKLISNPLVAKYAGRIAYAIPPTVTSIVEDVTKGISSGDIKKDGFAGGVLFNASVNLFFNVLVGPGVVEIREIRPLLNGTGYKTVSNGVDVYKILTAAERKAIQEKYSSVLGDFTRQTLHIAEGGFSKAEEGLLNFMFELAKIIKSVS